MLFLLIGWMRRAVILGAKLDECQACHVAGPHLILRRSNWFTIFRVPIILLWLSHGLLCPECGDYKPLGFMQVRRALKSGRLPLDRQRPAYEAAVHELVGGTSPADWATIGLEPDATPDALKARWHELAKTNHPDHGGDTQTFVRMQAAYSRLSTAPSTDVGFVPDPKDLFDPIVKNPKRGFFDAYLKVWPVLAAIVLASAALSPHPAAAAPVPGRRIAGGARPDGGLHVPPPPEDEEAARICARRRDRRAAGGADEIPLQDRRTRRPTSATTPSSPAAPCATSAATASAWPATSPAPPPTLTATARMSDSGIDEQFSATLGFDNDLLAVFDCGMYSPVDVGVEVLGTDGRATRRDALVRAPRAAQHRGRARRGDDRVPTPGPNAYRLEIDNVCAAARGEAEPEISAEETVRNLTTDRATPRRMPPSGRSMRHEEQCNRKNDERAHRDQSSPQTSRAATRRSAAAAVVELTGRLEDLPGRLGPGRQPTWTWRSERANSSRSSAPAAAARRRPCG